MSEREEVTGEVEVSWSEAEFSEAEFGDKRLKKPLVKIAAGSLKQPLATINQASEDWADAKAAYRFFDNKKVASEEVLSPHRARTIERTRGYSLVLSVQETTEIYFTRLQMKLYSVSVAPLETATGSLLHQ